MSRKNFRERTGRQLAALPKWLAPSICIAALITAALVWLYWPASPEKTAGAEGETQSISVADEVQKERAPETLGLCFEAGEGEESIIRSKEISSITAQAVEGDARSLNRDEADELLALFSEAEVTQFLYPTHLESQTSNRVYVICITFSDGQEDVLYSTEIGAPVFYRYTGTYGSGGDKGYVLAKNPSLTAFFDKLEL